MLGRTRDTAGCEVAGEIEANAIGAQALGQNLNRLGERTIAV
jgi:hypothetical protein